MVLTEEQKGVLLLQRLEIVWENFKQIFRKIYKILKLYHTGHLFRPGNEGNSSAMVLFGYCFSLFTFAFGSLSNAEMKSKLWAILNAKIDAELEKRMKKIRSFA